MQVNSEMHAKKEELTSNEDEMKGIKAAMEDSVPLSIYRFFLSAPEQLPCLLPSCRRYALTCRSFLAASKDSSLFPSCFILIFLSLSFAPKDSPSFASLSPLQPKIRFSFPLAPNIRTHTAVTRNTTWKTPSTSLEFHKISEQRKCVYVRTSYIIM